jgi:hypothetical protein
MYHQHVDTLAELMRGDARRNMGTLCTPLSRADAENEGIVKVWALSY